MPQRLVALLSLIIVLVLAGNSTVRGTPSVGRGLRPSFMPLDTNEKMLGEVRQFEHQLREINQAWGCECRRSSLENFQRQGGKHFEERIQQIPDAEDSTSRSKRRDCHNHTAGHVQTLCPVPIPKVTNDINIAFAFVKS